MSDLVFFVSIVAAIAAVGVALGIIVAGRMDRLMAQHTPEPSSAPADPADPAEAPTAPPPPQEEQP